MSQWEQRTLDPHDPHARNDARPDLDRVHLEGRVVVTKTARGRGRTSLRREAEILDRLQLGGMVEMAHLIDGDETTTLVMEDAGRRTFADPVGLSSEELLRALRRCCTAVHDLHRAGWTHGSIRPDHVVIGLRGRARLCSFGAARPIDSSEHGDRVSVETDVHHLVELLDHVAALGQPDTTMGGRMDWRRTARRLGRLAADSRGAMLIDSSSISAADLSESLASLNAPRRLRGQANRSSSGRRMPRTAATFSVGIVAALVGTIAWVLVTGTGGLAAPTREDAGARPPGSRARPATPAATAITRTDPDVTAPACDLWPSVGADVDGDGCPETIRVAGNLVTVDDVGYRLGTDGDLAAVGDWDCDGVSTARLLRPTTGELFEFPTWAGPGIPSEAFAVTTVTSASGLRRAPSQASPGPDAPGRTVGSRGCIV